MRLPRSRTYRAFAELDRFSNAQCDTFVRGVKRSKWRRVRHITATWTVGLLLFAAIAGALGYLGWQFEDHIQRMRSVWLFYAGLALGVILLTGVPFLGALLTKDFLLRRALRRVINTRGSCIGCGYGLTSLPVPASGPVICPECGHGLVVDITLGEVVPDEHGVNRYMPSPELVGPIDRWLTPRRRKWLLRIVIGGPILTALLLGAALGGYEWFLRAQARRAIAMRPSSAQIEQRLLAAQPKDTDPPSPSAWAKFFEADAQLSAHDGPRWLSVMRSSQSAVYPDFDLIRHGIRSDALDSERSRDAVNLQLALQLIDEYRAVGVYDTLDQMAARPRAVRSIMWPGGSQPLMGTLLPELGRCRNFARINAARMHLARKSANLPEFISAFEANLALSRMLSRGPFLIDTMVSTAIHALTFESLEPVLSAYPDAQWLDAVEAAINRQPGSIDAVEIIENERLMALDTVCWIFSDPDMVRMGRFSPKLLASRLLAPSKGIRPDVGTLSSHVAGVTADFDGLVNLAKQDPFERPAAAGSPAYAPFVSSVFGTWDWRRTLVYFDQDRFQRRGARVMIALERWRLRTGQYPPSLHDLLTAPSPVNPADLLDPWSGQLLVYRTTTADSGGNPGYLLYSVGADAKDDGGVIVVSARPFEGLHMGRSQAADAVLNFSSAFAAQAQPATPPAGP